MPTWAQRQVMAAQAREASAPQSASAPGRATGLDKMLGQLKGDLDAIRAVKSLETRAEIKRSLIPKYAPWVQEVLAADTGRQDPVVVHVMIWCLDTGAWTDGLNIARYVIRHGLAMPEGWERDAATWLVEELARAAETDPDALPWLDDAMTLTADHDMHDQVRARALKVLGLAVEDTDPPQAEELLSRALRLDARAGVKPALARIRKRLAEDQARAAIDPGEDA
jgi:hypothetical protein